jgi:hypothetical protein
MPNESVNSRILRMFSGRTVPKSDVTRIERMSSKIIFRSDLGSKGDNMRQTLSTITHEDVHKLTCGVAVHLNDA